MFAEIINQLDEHQLISADLTETILFTKRSLKLFPNLSSLELRYSLINFCKKYCGNSDTIKMIFNEYLIAESTYDPYHLIENLIELTQKSIHTVQDFIQEAFDTYLRKDIV